MIALNEPDPSDRAYILRFRPEGAEADEYLPVATFTITSYRCGLHAGERIRLKEDAAVYRAGEILTVLTGAEEDPYCLWTLDATGRTCSWDDKPEIFDLFERVD
jgi:hypothetical protein